MAGCMDFTYAYNAYEYIVAEYTLQNEQKKKCIKVYTSIEGEWSLKWKTPKGSS